MLTWHSQKLLNDPYRSRKGRPEGAAYVLPELMQMIQCLGTSRLAFRDGLSETLWRQIVSRQPKTRNGLLSKSSE